MSIYRMLNGDPYAVVVKSASEVTSEVVDEVIITHVMRADDHPIVIAWSFDVVLALLVSLQLPELAKRTRP